MRPSVIVGAGVVAALNFGKLPPALPALQAEFGLSLVQVSWMVSLFMIASALLGIAGGSIADRFDPRRVMVCGLLLMASSSAAGAMASTPAVLFASRAFESLGFLLTVLPELAREFAEYRMLVFGLVMIVMMVWRPQGLLPMKRHQVEIK